MKKIFTTLFIILMMTSSVFAKTKEVPQSGETITLQGGTTFDWLDISQIQRETVIENYKNIIFAEDTVYKYKKKDYREKYSAYLKDAAYKTHYMEAKEGITETPSYNLSAFYKGSILVIYAIQYKSNLKEIYYYDCLGNLRYVDEISDNYPNFPYWSKQYRISGGMISAIYFTSKDMQYMYEPDGAFQGVWFKDKMYDRHAKQTLTRTNW